MSPDSSADAWPVKAKVSWRFQLDVPPVSMHAAPDDSFLLVADVFGTVRCLDTATGELRWEHPFGMNNVHSVRATSAGSSTVLLEEGRLIRLDPQGEMDWESSVGALRSAFDVSADGGLVALAAAVHEMDRDEVKVGSKVTIYGEGGRWLRDVLLDHAVTRMRFTSSQGDLVCTSPEGYVSFLEPDALLRQTDLGATLDGLVTCLDGSLILVPAGGDGIHVLSASMESLGVLEVSGTVEDVDVSEDGSSVLVKERDGLVYLLDGHFHLCWRGRLRRPVLRVDLASDGSHVFIAESTGRVLRVDFLPSPAPPARPSSRAEGAATLPCLAEVSLGSVPVRAGLGRALFAGDTLAVLPRPDLLLVLDAGSSAVRQVELDFHAAHLTPDGETGRLALWSNRRLAVVQGEDLTMIPERSVAAVTFCRGGDLAVGTASGELHRHGGDLQRRWSVRVGAGVVDVVEAQDGGELVVLCADGCVSIISPDGVILATTELSAPAVPHPDLLSESGDESELGSQEFWAHYGRAYGLVLGAAGPILHHGGGRLLLLDLQGNLVHQTHLGAELSAVRPMGDTLLVVRASGLASVLSAELEALASFHLHSTSALPARLGDRSVVLDFDDTSVLLRDTRGAVLGLHQVHPAPRALALSPEHAQAAAVLDTRLLRLDLSAFRQEPP